MEAATNTEALKVRFRKATPAGMTRYYVHVDGNPEHIGWVVKGTARDERGEFTNWTAYVSTDTFTGRQVHMGEATRREATAALLQKLNVGTHTQRQAWAAREFDKAYGVAS